MSATLFFILLLKVFPIYINVVLGYLSARFLHVQQQSVATLLIYVLSPIVVFSATISVTIDRAVAILPIFLNLFSSIIAFSTLALFQHHWRDPTGNILAFSAGTGNTGYFGIPLALIFFEPPLADLFIFAVLSSLLYESTTGFYVTAKGHFTVQEALKKIVRLPILYAFVLEILFNLAGLEIPRAIESYTGQFKGAYGILGMMMLGMGLTGLKNSERTIDLKFIAIAFALKFLFWPLAMLACIHLDRTLFHLLNANLYKVLFLFSVVPLAGNTVTLAVLLRAKPEKASLAVFLSTVLSIITIPLYLFWYGGF